MHEERGPRDNRTLEFTGNHYSMSVIDGEIMIADRFNEYGDRFPLHNVSTNQFDWQLVADALREFLYEHKEDFDLIFSKLHPDSAGMLVLKRMVNEEKLKKLKEISQLDEYL